MYRALSFQYYREADGCLLVYDITRRDSFEEIKNYFCKQIREKCKTDIKIILLGNKTDLKNERKVSTKEGVKLAVENGFTFMETSCLENRNVADSFETLIELIHEKEIKKERTKENTSEKQTITIKETNVSANSKKRKCC